MLSVRGKKYKFLAQKDYPFEDVAPEILSIILDRIHKNGAGEVRQFLDPKLKNLMPDPELHIPGMKEAVARMLHAIEQKETIGILGDYDVDGACSSALLIHFLRHFDVPNYVYIPDRLNEGYGPNHNAFAYFKEKNCMLILTVDCGTAAKDILDAYDTDMIVLDHHLPPKEIPNKMIVNPQLHDVRPDLKYLCAAGIVFLFLAGCNRHIPNSTFKLIEYLDIVALATVCDVMILQGLNRAYVKQGLKVLETTNNKGIRALAKVAGLRTISSPYDCGFIIGPRINAGGRVGSSFLGVELLTSDTPDKIAQELDMFNTQRKAIEQQILASAIKKNYSNTNPCILVGEEGWHAGVVGIIAARLKEIYNKPALVVGFIHGHGIGSARSIDTVDIGALLHQAQEEGLVLSGGGHAKAGGFKIRMEQMGAFSDFLNRRIGEMPAAEIYETIDLKKELSGLTKEFHSTLSLLQPFGNGNGEPLIFLQNITIHKQKLLKEEHLQCELLDAFGKKMKAIAFYAARFKLLDAFYKANQIYNAIGYFRNDSFQITDLIEG